MDDEEELQPTAVQAAVPTAATTAVPLATPPPAAAGPGGTGGPGGGQFGGWLHDLVARWQAARQARMQQMQQHFPQWGQHPGMQPPAAAPTAPAGAPPPAAAPPAAGGPPQWGGGPPQFGGGGMMHPLMSPWGSGAMQRAMPQARNTATPQQQPPRQSFAKPKDGEEDDEGKAY